MAYLECQPGPNFVGQDLGDHPVEGRQDLHGQLRLDATFVDQVIEGIGQGQAETRRIRVSPHTIFRPRSVACRTCSHGRARSKTAAGTSWRRGGRWW